MKKKEKKKEKPVHQHLKIVSRRQVQSQRAISQAASCRFIFISSSTIRSLPGSASSGCGFSFLSIYSISPLFFLFFYFFFFYSFILFALYYLNVNFLLCIFLSFPFSPLALSLLYVVIFMTVYTLTARWSASRPPSRFPPTLQKRRLRYWR